MTSNELASNRELDALCDRCNGDLEVCISYNDHLTYEQSVRHIGGELLERWSEGSVVRWVNDLDDLGRAWCALKGYTFACIEIVG